MAAMIELNADVVFGGAVVIIPPENGGEPIELLILDSGRCGTVLGDHQDPN